MSILGKILKFLAIFGVLVVFAWLGAQLFFPDQYKEYAAPYLNKIFVQQNGGVEQKHELDKLTISFAQGIQTLEPTSMDFNIRNRLLQIYEPLVQTDKFLNVEPALAISQGQIDDKTWEFKIRPGVKFHNGKLLTADDVLASIMRAKKFVRSDLKNILGSIDAKISDKNSIIVSTKFPDPLILQKLSFVLIMPKEYASDDTPLFIGTGPYKYSNWEKGKEMNFARYDDYWGEKPVAKNLKIKIISDKEARINALTSGEISLLGDVPPTYIESLNKAKVSIKTMPSLEVTFLLFNMKSHIFSDKKMREAVAMSIDKKRFMLSSVGYTKEVNQFVSSGVFGFNKDIKSVAYDPRKASEITNSVSEFTNIPLKFAVPEGMIDVGKDIVGMLRQAGFDVTFVAYKNSEFENIANDDSIDIYLMGWKSDIADADDFLQLIVHAKDEKRSFGMYNAERYSNEAVDKMIEEAAQETNIGKRLQTLHEIMKIITENDIIGVPLFETQVIYGIASNIDFEPRADGYILAKDIK